MEMEISEIWSWGNLLGNAEKNQIHLCIGTFHHV